MAGLRSRSVDGNGLNSPSFSPQFDKDSNTKISRSRSSSPNKFDPSMTKFAFFLMLEIDTRSDAFKKFLSFEYCDENLSFWRATFDYRHMAIKASRMKRKRRAQEIVKQFIVDDAPEMINISGKVRQIILKEVLHGRTCHSGMFNKAVEEVEQMLVMGPFPRFASKTDKIIHESWRIINERVSPSEFGKM